MTVWKQEDEGQWTADDGLSVVFAQDDGTFAWELVAYEFVVVGGYPGSPDWKEHHLGEGVESTLAEAQWKAQRRAARTLIAEDAWEDYVTEEAEQAWRDEQAWREQQTEEESYDDSWAV